MVLSSHPAQPERVVLAAQIREAFLSFFERHGHTRVHSSSLVPENDPSLLFTNAGMVQFKDFFLGRQSAPYQRATSVQKCVRAGGKHNDLENVGFTARHHTFFEMLGNFSFGDYFKKEAITMAWDFITKVLQMDPTRLYVTVFETDDEAAQLWESEIGIAPERIYRFGEKDNFWSMGEIGPCGPCSEIFYDRGAAAGCGRSTCAMGCDCDRYLEFWNLVFMQFDRNSEGVLHPLPRPSVDTGAGLERLTCLLQQCQTNYQTELFTPLIKAAQVLLPSGVACDESASGWRVIADHARASAFLLGDGVLPSNEGRGYVLRRILRRAIRHGKNLGFAGPFLHQIASRVVEQMGDAYPELQLQRSLIDRAILSEEEQFLKTLAQGLKWLDSFTQGLASGAILDGDQAFQLYDTYGFPLDLTRVICAERGFQVDEAGFARAMAQQKNLSRQHWRGSGDQTQIRDYQHLREQLQRAGRAVEFVGYDSGMATGECLALFEQTKEGLLEPRDSYAVDSVAEEAQNSGAIVEAVFSATPFYAEGGGQVGDRGRVRGIPAHLFLGEVLDVRRPVPEIIVVQLHPRKGRITVGETYEQETDQVLRDLTAKNHTATHLLQWALRSILGKHVKQAGSLVNSELLRFDFTHYAPMSVEELERIEDLINVEIWADHPVTKEIMRKDLAIAQGAMAMFGEKYGDMVRVVRVGDFSTELCGGTHVDHSGALHLFKVGSESGIAAGVRRIVAHTSQGAFALLRAKEAELRAIRLQLKLSADAEIRGRIEKMAATETQLRRQLGTAQAQASASLASSLLSQTERRGDCQMLVSYLPPQLVVASAMRPLWDGLKQKCPNIVAVLLGGSDPLQVVVGVGPGAPDSLQARTLLSEILPLIQGKGGGKHDFAQGAGPLGTKSPEQIVAQARDLLHARMAQL